MARMTEDIIWRTYCVTPCDKTLRFMIWLVLTTTLWDWCCYCHQMGKLRLYMLQRKDLRACVLNPCPIPPSLSRPWKIMWSLFCPSSAWRPFTCLRWLSCPMISVPASLCSCSRPNTSQFVLAWGIPRARPIPTYQRSSQNLCLSLLTSHFVETL